MPLCTLTTQTVALTPDTIDHDVLLQEKLQQIIDVINMLTSPGLKRG